MPSSDFFSSLCNNSERLLKSINVRGAAKTVRIGQNENFEMTTWSYSSAFSEQFVLYLKVLAILVPEI